jgi:hypothetical protein
MWDANDNPTVGSPMLAYDKAAAARRASTLRALDEPR